ncbi:hypothetical protein P691DRAFT_141540 [Macrolepiota fuliginosa MF-IS2]|uniref:Secreted protein n=1 Tax=Macrolepiota fuliginosa MF-IS2 TaxID=1400762 RepID=A0A9P5X939_9AGAR|nr:hypothetical protein P691DRAFT_141540 [Macrolepiota fuliginosa MF-IS2]
MQRALDTLSHATLICFLILGTRCSVSQRVRLGGTRLVAHRTLHILSPYSGAESLCYIFHRSQSGQLKIVPITSRSELALHETY